MRILICGGAGYVGSELVKELSWGNDYHINVFDTFWFWNSPDEFRTAIQFSKDKTNKLSLFQGDIRDKKELVRAMRGCDQIINLACISNDPSSELNAELTEEVNFDGVLNVIELAASLGVERFIHASSSSVYGIKKEERVTEELKVEPLTAYSRFKAEIDDTLLEAHENGYLNTIIVRPATVCGYSLRQRLDLVVNIFCQQAWERGEITVHGGSQYRPNLAIRDMVSTYRFLMNHELQPINGQIFNAGDNNYTLLELATLVQKVMKQMPFNKEVAIKVEPTADLRSYRLDSSKLASLGWKPRAGVESAIFGLLMGLMNKSVKFDKSSNIHVMKEVLNAK